MIKAAAVLLFLALNYYTYHHLASAEVIPEREVFESFPEEIGDWRCVERERMDQEIIRELGATDYLICNFRKGGEVINAYVGYHATQVRKEGGGANENSIHPPEHCLPGSGWDVIDARVVPFELPGLPLEPGEKGEAKRFVIAKGNERQLVYFWYQSRGRVIARNHEVIVYRFWDRATRGRTDGSLVRITIPLRGEERTEAFFRDFASEFVKPLPRYVPN